jgi:hypothetical protein
VTLEFTWTNEPFEPMTLLVKNYQAE